MKRRWIFLGVLFLGFSSLHASTPAAQNKILSQVDFVQNLGTQVPLQLRFRDETGRPVALTRYFQTKPVILSLVYYQCPMLCTESLNGLLRAMRSLSLSAGRDYNVVTVSFDPNETPDLAAKKKQAYVERYGRSGGVTGWTFLVGDPEPIRRLTDAVGFHYVYDPGIHQYAHATGIVVLTPSGRVSRYLYGVEYSARDLRLALVEASAGHMGTPIDKILLYCYHYDPLTGKYNLAIFRILRTAGAATVIGLVACMAYFLRREQKGVVG